MEVRNIAFCGMLLDLTNAYLYPTRGLPESVGALSFGNLKDIFYRVLTLSSVVCRDCIIKRCGLIQPM